MVIRHRSIWVFVLMLLAGLAACEDPSPEELVRRAEQYREKGDVKASIIELKNALQKDPSNARARLLLGKNYISVGDLISAEKELLRAREFGISLEDFVQPMARVWLMHGNDLRILEDLQIEPSWPAPYKHFVLTVRGIAHYRLGQLAEAELAFRDALASDQNGLTPLVGLVSIAIQRNELAEADSILTRAEELAPNNPNILVLKGKVDFRRGKYAAAEANYALFLQAVPQNITMRLDLARAQIIQGKIEQAIAHIEEILKRVPEHPGANYLRAVTAAETGDYRAARLYSERVLIADPKHRGSRLVSGSASYGLGEMEQAYEHLGIFLATAPSQHWAHRYFESARSRLNRGDGGQSLLRPLIDASAEELDLVGSIDASRRRGHDLETLVAYYQFIASRPDGTVEEDGETANTAARLTPDTVAVLHRLARGERQDDTEALRLELEEDITERPDAVSSRIVLGVLYLRRDQPRDALTLVQEVPKQDRAGPLLALMGLARLHLGETGLARSLFHVVIDQDPGAPAAHYLLALTYRDEEDIERFQEQLRRVVELNPNHLQARVSLAKTLLRQGEIAAGKAWLDGLGEAAVYDVEVLELRGAIALLEGRKADAVAAFTKALEQGPSSNLTLKLAFSQRQAGELDDSAKTLESWLEDHPADIDVRLALANSYLSSQDLDLARRQYAKIILLIPNHVVVLNNLAWVHARLGNPGVALPYAERAYTLAPSEPLIMDTLGSILTELGDTERAVDLLRRAVKRESGSPEIQAHLARALARHGDVGEARDVLRQVLSNPRDFSDRQEAESLLIELGG